MPLETIQIDGMLEQFALTSTTVWFYEMPNPNQSAQWVGSEIFPGLTDAVQAVIDDYGGHFGYDVIVHDGQADRPISQKELVALIAKLGGLRRG